ncbi:DUF2798 domain-containing protein [Ahrensia sp. R2A130]|uniref:DUF2798 domain-containing protein n=1 Tax=Ahrensia sp. R2A130 TaxID=744979 RepID=UPI003528EAA4
MPVTPDARGSHALLLSGVMSFIVSGIATARVLGVSDGFLMTWLPSWARLRPSLFPACC